jgi:hypothetical protein
MSHSFTEGSSSSAKLTAGKSLKRIFHQDDSLKKIEVQPASESLLMNQLRLSIFVHLCNVPGSHTRSIARAMGCGPNAVTWNLRRRSDAGFIESANIWGKRMHWVSGMVKPADAPMVLALRQDWALDILKIVVSGRKRVTQALISNRMRASQQKVSIWLGKMTAAGLLDKQGTGRKAEYSFHPGAAMKHGEYRNLAGGHSRIVLSMLHSDGLMPSKNRLRGSRLSVIVKVPSGSRKLSIECNPLTRLKQFITPKT